jgi:UDP-3-O-[3-hydroxymyristoyl] glucosamine N-acyltransferase
MKVSEIARIIKGNVDGSSELEISGVAKIESANANEISFISNPLYIKFYQVTKAGALIISEDLKLNPLRKDITLIRVPEPYLAFLDIIQIFDKEDDEYQAIEGNYIIGENFYIEENVIIGDFVKFGNNCKVGTGSVIYPNCFFGNGVEIGKNCIIYPNVTIYRGCKIASNVILHSGSVIGSDGFGQAKQNDGSFKKIPQTGIVVIEDNVEIGSNTCIDRATIGETRICKGVKLDNQIQIAHNVVIGENTVIAAQSGIAGSTTIGKRVMMGGKSSAVGHISICDDAIIGAGVNVSKSITTPGLYLGYRARPAKEELRKEAGINKIFILENKIKELESIIKEIKNQSRC